MNAIPRGKVPRDDGNATWRTNWIANRELMKVSAFASELIQMGSLQLRMTMTCKISPAPIVGIDEQNVRFLRSESSLGKQARTQQQKQRRSEPFRIGCASARWMTRQRLLHVTANSCRNLAHQISKVIHPSIDSNAQIVTRTFGRSFALFRLGLEADAQTSLQRDRDLVDRTGELAARAVVFVGNGRFHVDADTGRLIGREDRKLRPRNLRRGD